MSTPTPTTFGVVGSGWRSAIFLRLARVAPDQLRASGVVTRTAERGAQVEAELGVPAVRTVAALAALRPDLVLVSVPASAAPAALVELAGLGVPALCETPPAGDVAGLRRLWAQVGGSDLVQVAEQYLLMPHHAARREVVRSGAIGEVTSVQVSSTQLHHAASIVRLLLGAGGDPVEVVAREFTAPLADPVSRAGWTGRTEPAPATTTLATLDFGGGRWGLYDFTSNQTRNPLRSERIVVRGTTGEVVDDRVVRLVDATTVLEEPIVRRQTGTGLNLEGAALDHLSHAGRVVHRNPFPGARFTDDETAVAVLLRDAAAWCRGEGPGPYPLADGCQDALLGSAIEEAARTGLPVRTAREPWAAAVRTG